MRKGRFSVFILLGLALFVCDRVLKYWVCHSSGMPYGRIMIFQHFFGIDFYITRVVNKGGAWGVFASYFQLLLILRIVIIFCLLLYAFFFNKERSRDFPFTLILAGAFGNIIDCFFYGAVIDLFHFILWGYSFPVFNLADAMIFCGIAMLLLQMLFKKRFVKREIC
jgi:signal peptidase II